MNGATCVDGINSNACKCAPGYAGTNCQIGRFEKKPCLKSMFVDDIYNTLPGNEAISNCDAMIVNAIFPIR